METKHTMHVRLEHKEIAALERLALDHGLVVQSGGPRQDKPNVTELMRRIAGGELCVKTAKPPETKG